MIVRDDPFDFTQGKLVTKADGAHEPTSQTSASFVCL